MKYDLNLLHAPIIPGESMGGFKLYSSIRDYIEVIEEFGQISHMVTKETKYEPYWEMDLPHWVEYEIKDTLRLTFNVCNGKLEKILALQHYKGLLLGQIYVGMELEEAKKIVDIYWTDDSEDYFITGVSGVAFGTTWVNNKEVINCIVVYIKEIDESEISLEKEKEYVLGMW